jgi:tRNA(His) guanylyltransferase
MQKREIFGNLTIIPPIFVRVDGRSFHRLTRSLGLNKPYDEKFVNAMVGVCTYFLQESGLNPVFAYTFSDEISLYFDHLPFNGRVEKIDSVCAAYAASALTLKLDCQYPIAFDARIIPVSPQPAREYLVSRQQEAWRNHINAYSQAALMKEGKSSRNAAASLKGMASREMHEMMFERGINLAKTPAWQRRGVVVCRKTEKKEGYNPLKNEHVETERHVIHVIKDPPLFNTPRGEELIKLLLGSQ